MKINELRIGNRVNRLGEPTIIDAIQKGVDIDYVSTPKSGAITINQIEPILLTRELFLKCERIQQIGSNFRLFPNIGLYEIIIKWNFARASFSLFVNDQFIRRDLQYLHDFQNFYAALTGEELIIDL